MQLSDVANMVVRNALLTRYNSIIGGKLPDPIDIQIYDFDGGRYHISNVDSIRYIRVSLGLSCYSDLLEHGITQFLKKEYGPLLIATEPEYSVTLMLDISKVPIHYEELARRISLLKRNCYASVLDKYMSFKGSTMDKLKQIYVYYRENEVMYMEAKAGEMIITFSMLFKDYDEYLFASIFLKEFSEGRRVYKTAPKIAININEPPQEILKNLCWDKAENRLSITIALSTDHTHPNVRNNSINLIYYFRYYLHCQIIRARIHLRTFMRKKTEYFLKLASQSQQKSKDKPKVKWI